MATVATSEPEPYVTLSRAARATGVNVNLIRRLVREGKLPSVEIGDAVRVRVSEVQSAIRPRAVAGGA